VSVFFVQSLNRMFSLVAPSGECLGLQGEGLVWLIGAVVCSPRVHCSLARAMDGRISAAAPLALADQLPLR